MFVLLNNYFFFFLLFIDHQIRALGKARRDVNMT